MNLGKENEYQEFKKSLSQLDKGLKSLSAMLNRNSEGTVFFGVDDQGEITGIDSSEKTLMKIRHRIRELIEPNAIYDIRELETDDGKKYISVHASGTDKPYSCDGRYYIRTLSSDEHASNELLRKMLLSGGMDIISEMKTEHEKLTFSGMCKELMLHGIHAKDTEEFRMSYGLYNKEKIFSFMAFLLSDQNSLVVKVMRFSGTDKSVVDERMEYTNQSLLLTVQQVLDYFDMMNRPRKVDLEHGIRKEMALFHGKSFREAWINACVHNNWGGRIPPSVYLYDDRMEIVSYGGLPYDLTEEGFYSGHSIPVNDRLFRIFIACNHSEQSGHGVPEIVRNYGKKAFSFENGMLTVTIPFNYEPEIVTIRKAGEKAAKRITKNQRNVMLYLQEHRTAYLQEVADACGLSIGGVKKIVAKLQADGFIEREGTRKNPQWFLK